MTEFVRLDEQPISTEIKMADGIFVKSMLIQRAGTFVPQHSHSYDHLSMLAVGAVAVWEDGEPAGTHYAPKGLTIRAGVKHTFRSLVDNTLIYCVHRIDRTGEVEIAEEHQIVSPPTE